MSSFSDRSQSPDGQGHGNHAPIFDVDMDAPLENDLRPFSFSSSEPDSDDSFDNPVVGARAWQRPTADRPVADRPPMSEPDSDDSFDNPVAGARAWQRPTTDRPVADRPPMSEPDSDDSFDTFSARLHFPNQRGSGPLKKVPTAVEVTPNLHYPTNEELDYLHEFVTLKTVAPSNTLNPKVVRCGDNALVLKNLSDAPVPLPQHLEKIFDIFIRHMFQRHRGDLREDKYWLSLNNLGVGVRAFHVNHEPYIQATGTHLINRVAAVMQSKEDIVLNDALLMTVFMFKSPNTTSGGCRKTAKIVKDLLCPTHHIRADTHCLPISLLIGKYYYEKTAKQMANLVRMDLLRSGNQRKPIGERQIMAARAMLEKNGIAETPDGVYDIGLIKELVEKDDFKEYRVDVFVSGCDPNAIQRSYKFPTINPNAKKAIALFYDHEHYEPINIRSWTIGTKCGFYWCTRCFQMIEGSTNVARHFERCDAKCRKCGSYSCGRATPGFKKQCEDCKTIFFDQKCFDQHTKKEKGDDQRDTVQSHCELYMFCEKCSRKVSRLLKGKDHVCGFKYCTICREVLAKNHLCSFAPPSATEREKCLKAQEFWRFFIYDFESIVTSSTDQPDGSELKGPAHEPNLVCGQFICKKCPPQNESKTKISTCHSCGPMITFKYDDDAVTDEWTVVKRFADFILTDERFDKCVILAHNGGKYDHGFVLPELTTLDETTPELLMDGNRVIQAKHKFSNGRTVYFKDTLNFLPMALKQMPTAFGFAKDLVKGTFPYMFNHPSRYGKTFPTHPHRDFYQPDLMSEKDREKFNVWYEERKDTPFDFDEEIQQYCESDVKILVKAVRKYLNICAEIFQNWNPIIQTTTLAGFVMFVLKHEHIKRGVVGYIPENGFPRRNNSVLALKYLQWLDEQDASLRIQHSLNKGEKRITHEDCSYYADGYSESTNTVFEVYGCMWHGCPQCYPDSTRICPCRPGITFEKLLTDTRQREDHIRSAGFNLHIKWECEIRKELTKNTLMKEFFDQCRHTYQLLPRESMFGGRTQQFQAIVKADDEHTIEYYDYCSLYPWTNMKGAAYPRGQPQRITSQFTIPKSGEKLIYRGLVFCDVLPPTSLDFPVLPYRANSKLLFPLCRKCAATSNGKKCTHFNENDRFLTGCWVTEELNYAIKKGYVIKRIHEAWHWSDDKWFRGGFFASYLSPLLRIKHEASGWPKPDMNEEEKTAHINTIIANDGVSIRPECVVSNPALRQTVKLFLNSAWGKFSQNPKKAEVTVTHKSNGEAMTNFFETPGFKPKHFGMWGPDHVLMSRLPEVDSLKPSKYTNIVFGAITTAVARLRLYEAMDRVGAKNLIYCDTDSVIFKQRIGQDLLGDLRGDGLGMLTNEIPSGTRITEVITMAPKVYGLKMEDQSGKVSYSIKAKGMTLNCKTAESVTFDNMKKMMTDYVAGKVVDPLVGISSTIKTTLKRPALRESNMVVKKLKPVNNKGVMEGMDMTPYGKINNNVVENYPFIQS